MFCKTSNSLFKSFQQQTIIDNVKSCAEVLQDSSHNLFLSLISLSQSSVIWCKCSACWMSFPISMLKVCCQFVYSKIALYLVKHHFSQSLLRVGNRLIGRLFEPVKGILLFLGSGITFASLQAWGHTRSSRLRLKIWQIGVTISSASILSNFPSKLSDAGGLSLLRDNFFTSSTLTLQNSKLQCLSHNLMCNVSGYCWHVMPKFANLANEKIIIK